MKEACFRIGYLKITCLKIILNWCDRWFLVCWLTSKESHVSGKNDVPNSGWSVPTGFGAPHSD